MRKFLPILLVFYFQNSFGQREEVIEEYFGQTRDTTVVIKLLAGNRIILEKHPSYSKFDNLYSKNVDDIKSYPGSIIGKAICVLPSKTYYYSYGKYELKDNRIELCFQDENPIEKVDLNHQHSKVTNDSIKVIVKKDQDTAFDLIISQNEKRLSSILSFAESSEF